VVNTSIFKIKKLHIHIYLFNLFLFLMLFIYPLRFGVHNSFMFLPLLGTTVLLSSYVINLSVKFRLNKLDFALLLLFFWSMYAVLFSIFNVGVEHAFKGFRIYVFPVLTYFLVRGLLHVGRDIALDKIIKFMIISLFFVLVYNLYLTVSITFLQHDTPQWFKNMDRLVDGWGSRSPGIFGDPHPSGLISVMAGIFILLNINHFAFFKGKFFKNAIKAIVIIGILLSTYRTSLIIGLLSYFLYFLYVTNIKLKIKGLLFTLACYLLIINFMSGDYGLKLNTYINIFIFWWKDPARFESAYNFIILDGFKILGLMYDQFSLTLITGVGFLSTDNDYNMVEYFRTNDQGWINSLQMFGLVGYAIFAYIVGFIIRLLIKVKGHRKDICDLLLACIVIVMTGFLSNMHSDVLKTHGLIQIFYTCLAIISYIYSSIIVKTKKNYKINYI
jgi:hypothetical protein